MICKHSVFYNRYTVPRFRPKRQVLLQTCFLSFARKQKQNFSSNSAFFANLRNQATSARSKRCHVKMFLKAIASILEKSFFFIIIFYLLAYLSSYHEKAIKALYELAQELPTISRPHQNGGIPLSALLNGATSKLAGLSSTLSL